MKEDTTIFKITIKRLPELILRSFYIVGNHAITTPKYLAGMSPVLKVVENFIFTHEHGGGAYLKDWELVSVEEIDTLYELKSE